MDDLKTFAKNYTDQQALLSIVKGFSGDIKMEFGLKQEDGHLQIPRHKRKRRNRTCKHERKIRRQYYWHIRRVLKGTFKQK